MLSPLAEETAAVPVVPTRSEPLSRLEAVLFLARQPLGTRKLAQLAGLADGTEARTLVRKLNQLYDAEGCAFRVEEVAGGLQLRSRSKFAPWLRRLHAVPVEVRLSVPALETLSVVAYRQPVPRAEIEAIRGVQCGEILRQLMERDLVRIVGRSEELGRPFLYGTTKQFLQVFGLRHLDELPRSNLLRAAPGETAPGGVPNESRDSTEEVFNQPLSPNTRRPT
jgi:segregation and condensation protein B